MQVVLTPGQISLGRSQVEERQITNGLAGGAIPRRKTLNVGFCQRTSGQELQLGPGASTIRLWKHSDIAFSAFKCASLWNRLYFLVPTALGRLEFPFGFVVPDSSMC